ncbi:hypothetical protein GCM10011581_32680 [Saccharopolyspora subtropica]|nr:hypothetical protein GCM10011581_32680 [Saccharopolyspora subtropica]
MVRRRPAGLVTGPDRTAFAQARTVSRTTAEGSRTRPGRVSGRSCLVRSSGCTGAEDVRTAVKSEGVRMGSVIKKRRKRMSKKKHRKLLRKTRVQRRKLGK